MNTSSVPRTLLVRPLVSALALVLALACAPNAEAPGEPAREIERYDAATFFDTVSISGGSFSADESKVLISTNEAGTFNVYAQPIDGSSRTPLTDSTTNAIYAVSYFPEDDRFLYTSDQGGNEINHLYVEELDGSVRDLTPAEGARGSFAGWSGDERSFYVLTNERDPRFTDLYRYVVDGYERELLFENDGYFVGDVSRDGRWVTLDRVRNNADSDVFVHDLESGETVHVTPHEGDVQFRSVTFTPDSSELYYSTDGEGEFAEIWSYDLATEERERVLADDWDVMFVFFSREGRYRVSAVNADAQTEITVIDTRTGDEVEVPQPGAGDVAGVRFSPSETKMLFYLNGDTAPSNLFVVDLEAGGDARQLTDTLADAIDPRDLVEGEVVRFASYDGLEIPGVLYRPHGASAEQPAPAMLWMHGGPGGQSRKGYSATIQHLVNHGYAIFAVNNRGSSGYGKTFFHLDDRQHGEADLGDCVAARDHLASLDWIDGERIGIMGGSYGGYLVAAALAFEPEVFDVGIDIFGVTNWLRTLRSMPVWWAAQRDALFAEMGDPETDEERLRRISPLFHAANIVRPLLVVQGANDPRVLQVESDELVAAVKANDVPVEYVVFPDEGHGFSRKENQIAASEAYRGFLDRHLRGDAAEAPATPTASDGE
ncbi:MAG TPA: alpha/beta fold hydrolase [Thermoanaerobaculia bacterium]|nr:alpha/beta fold hydrolase [Thermoanaerobaculia bacterium]